MHKKNPRGSQTAWRMTCEGRYSTCARVHGGKGAGTHKSAGEGQMLSVTRSDPTRFTEWKFLRLKYDDSSRLGGAILMWLPSMQPMMLGKRAVFKVPRVTREPGQGRRETNHGGCELGDHPASENSHTAHYRGLRHPVAHNKGGGLVRVSGREVHERRGDDELSSDAAPATPITATTANSLLKKPGELKLDVLEQGSGDAEQGLNCGNGGGGTRA